MKKWSYPATAFMVIVCLGVLFGSISAAAGASAQTTALEKKLYEAAKKEGKVIYWDSLSLKEASQIIKAFNNRYPGIEVSFWEGNANQCDTRYFAEVQAGRNPVDVFEVEWYRKYHDEGRLVDLSELIKDIGFPREFCSKDLDTVSIEHTVKAATYNTKLISPKDMPHSWEDLFNPKWKGRISLEASMDHFLALTKIWGEEKTIAYLKKLREQNPLFTRGVTHTMTLLAAGEFPLAFNTTVHRTLILKERGAPVGLLPFSPVVDIFAPYVAVKNAPHPNAAKVLLRWLMSPEGQAMVDEMRKKGNPLPGSGSVQAKAIEQIGMKVAVVPYWELDFKRLTELCLKAAGYIK